jgi:hypothetical protein
VRRHSRPANLRKKAVAAPILTILLMAIFAPSVIALRPAGWLAACRLSSIAD